MNAPRLYVNIELTLFLVVRNSVVKKNRDATAHSYDVLHTESAGDVEGLCVLVVEDTPGLLIAPPPLAQVGPFMGTTTPPKKKIIVQLTHEHQIFQVCHPPEFLVFPLRKVRVEDLTLSPSSSRRASGVTVTSTSLTSTSSQGATRLGDREL